MAFKVEIEIGAAGGAEAADQVTQLADGLEQAGEAAEQLGESAGKAEQKLSELERLEQKLSRASGFFEKRGLEAQIMSAKISGLKNEMGQAAGFFQKAALQTQIWSKQLEGAGGKTTFLSGAMGKLSSGLARAGELLASMGPAGIAAAGAAAAFAAAAIAAAAAVAALGVALFEAAKFTLQCAAETMDYYRALKNASQQTGVAAQDLAWLRTEAEMTGVSFQDVTSSLSSLTKNIAEAAHGNAEVAMQFNALGIAVRDLDGNVRPTVEVFRELSEKMNSMGDSSAKTSLAMKLMGDSGARILDMTDDLARGFDDVSERAMTAAGAFDSAAASASGNLDTAMRGLSETWAGFKRQIGADALKSLGGLAQTFISIGQAVITTASNIYELTGGIKTLIAMAGLARSALGFLPGIGMPGGAPPAPDPIDKDKVAPVNNDFKDFDTWRKEQDKKMSDEDARREYDRNLKKEQGRAAAEAEAKRAAAEAEAEAKRRAAEAKRQAEELARAQEAALNYLIDVKARLLTEYQKMSFEN